MRISNRALTWAGAVVVVLAILIGVGIYASGDDRSSPGDGAGESRRAVELVSHEGQMGEDGPVRVTGVVRNTSDREHSRVRVEVDFYDEAGREVGSASAETSGLGPEEEWQFEVSVTADRVSGYEIDRVIWQ